MKSKQEKLPSFNTIKKRIQFDKKVEKLDVSNPLIKVTTNSIFLPEPLPKYIRKRVKPISCYYGLLNQAKMYSYYSHIYIDLAQNYVDVEMIMGLVYFFNQEDISKVITLLNSYYIKNNVDSITNIITKPIKVIHFQSIEKLSCHRYREVARIPCILWCLNTEHDKYKDIINKNHRHKINHVGLKKIFKEDLVK